MSRTALLLAESKSATCRRTTSTEGHPWGESQFVTASAAPRPRRRTREVQSGRFSQGWAGARSARRGSALWAGTTRTRSAAPGAASWPRIRRRSWVASQASPCSGPAIGRRARAPAELPHRPGEVGPIVIYVNAIPLSWKRPPYPVSSVRHPKTHISVAKSTNSVPSIREGQRGARGSRSCHAQAAPHGSSGSTQLAPVDGEHEGGNAAPAHPR